MSKSQNTAALLHTVEGATGDELQSAATAPAPVKGATASNDKVNHGNIYVEASKSRAAMLEAKHQSQQRARQLLAEAVDMDREGGEKSAEAEQRAAEAGLLLAVDLLEGRTSREELTNMIGEFYGYRQKGNSKVQVKAGAKDASKTPFGRGEEMRKRIFRLSKGHEYVSNGEGDRFFSGDPAAKIPPLDTKDVAAVINATKEGKLGFWASYEKMAELRRKANENRETNPAFNLRTIGNIRAGLAENVEAARLAITADPALLAGYVALQDVLNLIWQPSASAAKAA